MGEMRDGQKRSARQPKLIKLQINIFETRMYPDCIWKSKR